MNVLRKSYQTTFDKILQKIIEKNQLPVDHQDQNCLSSTMIWISMRIQKVMMSSTRIQNDAKRPRQIVRKVLSNLLVNPLVWTTLVVDVVAATKQPAQIELENVPRHSLGETFWELSKCLHTQHCDRIRDIVLRHVPRLTLLSYLPRFLVTIRLQYLYCPECIFPLDF